MLDIPDFLKIVEVRKSNLLEAINELRKAGQNDLADTLESNIEGSVPKRLCSCKAVVTSEEQTEPQLITKPADKVRLTNVLKEREATKVLDLVLQGQDTYSKLKKLCLDERVLKASIRFALANRIGIRKLVKVSPKRYGVIKNGQLI